MTSKHPKRCSNHCVHETKSPFLYGWGCNAVRDDEGRPINITVVEERLINEIGCALYSNHLELPDSCASHSSASEPPEICCKCEDTPDVCGSDRIRCERAQAASEAREKVLALIATYLSYHGVEERIVGGDRFYEIEGTFSLADFITYIASLRSGGK